MEQWEFELRDDIFSAFLSNSRKMADELINDLIARKNGGVFFRYRPLNMAEILTLRSGQIYFCRAIRFDPRGDEWVRFKSYVACFTDRKHSLSMWNDYAQEGHGMCLEYTYDDICRFAEDNNLLFSPVRYSNEEPDPGSKYGSLMSMMSKPLIEADEYEWRLWKIDPYSSDIGKLMSSINPRRIILGRNVDRSSALYGELLETTGEKMIPLTASLLE